MRPHCASSSVFLLCSWITALSALYVEPIQVPAAIKLGDSYTLQCRYSLGPGETLYAIRWYRDGAEIVRYIPKDVPPHLVHYKVIKGLEIDRSSLKEGNVTLVNLRPGASGRYKCEVSLEAPTFETDEREANLTVIELPKGKTHMDLAKGTLQENDAINANCSGPQVSHLVPDIVWYLDTHPIPNDGRYLTRVVYNDSAFDESQRVRSLLYLPANWLRQYLEKHRKYQLYSSEPYYVVQLRCTSTLPGIYEDSDAFDVKIHKPSVYHVTNTPVYHRGVGGSAKSFSSSAVSILNVRLGWMNVMCILTFLSKATCLS